jgi:hypothetical protein
MQVAARSDTEGGHDEKSKEFELKFATSDGESTF